MPTDMFSGFLCTFHVPKYHVPCSIPLHFTGFRQVCLLYFLILKHVPTRTAVLSSASSSSSKSSSSRSSSLTTAAAATGAEIPVAFADFQMFKSTFLHTRIPAVSLDIPNPQNDLVPLIIDRLTDTFFAFAYQVHKQLYRQSSAKSRRSPLFPIVLLTE